MRLLTLAAGLATGYVLGTRAGRQKYEQIVDNARQLRENPTMAQAQKAVRNLARGEQAKVGGAERAAGGTEPAPRHSAPATGSGPLLTDPQA